MVGGWPSSRIKAQRTLIHRFIIRCTASALLSARLGVQTQINTTYPRRSSAAAPDSDHSSTRTHSLAHSALHLRLGVTEPGPGGALLAPRPRPPPPGKAAFRVCVADMSLGRSVHMPGHIDHNYDGARHGTANDHMWNWYRGKLLCSRSRRLSI